MPKIKEYIVIPLGCLNPALGPRGVKSYEIREKISYKLVETVEGYHKVMKTLEELYNVCIRR